MKHTQAKPIFFVLPRYIPYYYTARTLEDAYGKGVHEGEGWAFSLITTHTSPLALLLILAKYG